jgi:hypothetical protein
MLIDDASVPNWESRVVLTPRHCGSGVRIGVRVREREREREALCCEADAGHFAVDFFLLELEERKLTADISCSHSLVSKAVKLCLLIDDQMSTYL